MSNKSSLSFGFLLFAIIVLAINLRSPIIAIGPLVSFIRENLGASGSFMGLVAALPVLTFGLFSPFVAKLAQRFGIENVLIGGILLLILGIILRSVLPSVSLLVIGTFILSVGIAIGNVLLPALAKQRAPQRVGLIMGVLSGSMALSATLVSAVAVPIAHALNWQWGLGVWAILALLALGVWLYIRAMNSTQVQSAQAVEKVNMWRLPAAWIISLFFGIQALVMYSLINFMPSVLMEKGATALVAGGYNSLLQASCLAGSIIVPSLYAKAKNKQLFTVFTSVLYLIGIMGLWLSDLALMWLWIVILGIGTGVFIIALTIFSSRTANAQQAAQLSGMAQSVGYGLATLGPFGTGVLFDIFGSWTSSMSVFVCLLVIECGLGWVIAKPELISPR